MYLYFIMIKYYIFILLDRIDGGRNINSGGNCQLLFNATNIGYNNSFFQNEKNVHDNNSQC